MLGELVAHLVDQLGDIVREPVAVGLTTLARVLDGQHLEDELERLEASRQGVVLVNRHGGELGQTLLDKLCVRHVVLASLLVLSFWSVGYRGAEPKGSIQSRKVQGRQLFAVFAPLRDDTLDREVDGGKV